jgi:hypothetical protein
MSMNGIQGADIQEDLKREVKMKVWYYMDATIFDHINKIVKIMDGRYHLWFDKPEYVIRFLNKFYWASCEYEEMRKYRVFADGTNLVIFGEAPDDE